ncbi:MULTISPECIES: guanylate kinase [unclassified Minwuia]|jgi:guanylate kinase|uniref:guanylate kinase n=1 Tax=unclassified Minwuia TaxID=2618799 RepID=UPI00247892C5|nr:MULTISPECIES: guanylate kinase [unclassified Minwuia]
MPAGMSRKGLMFVISSPSGAGKTTIARQLLEQEPELSMSVSMTTRPQRMGEEEGRDYFFVDQASFDATVSAGGLLEHATVFGNSYGTPVAPVDAALAAGKDVLFDVDWQGAQQMRQRRKSDIVSVFILPPSAEELERRLTTRGRDPDDVVRQRMAKAATEMSHYAEYDYVVVNDDVSRCLGDVRAILHAERVRSDRLPDLADFVEGLSGGYPPAT